MKVLWPLQLFRILTVLFSSLLLTPILEALAQPLICSGKYVYGFDGIQCSDSLRYALYAASAVGALLIMSFSSLMSLMYYQPSPKSRVGKASGHVDFIYGWARLVMVLVTVLVGDNTASSVIITVITLILAVLQLFSQSYYDPLLNKIRFAMFFSAFAVCAVSIGGAAADVRSKDAAGTIPYVIAKLAIGFLAIPAGYYLNGMYMKYCSDAIFSKLQDELNYRKNDRLGNAKIRKSQLELIYQNVNEVVLTQAKDHEVTVYPSSSWAEVVIRFIRDSYLNDKAVTLATDMFDVAFEQFPKSAHLHLMYLEYSREFLPQVSIYKNKHIQFLNRRCTLSLAQKFHLYQYQQTEKSSGSKKGGVGGSDDELNFVSMVEYQSLENNVRKSHVGALQEIREFWQGIRNQKSKEELSVHLQRISAYVNITKDLYAVLLKRFPNSSQVMNLYARFTAVVLSDRDYAKELSDAAKDNEYLQNKVHGGEGDDKSEKSMNSIEQKSIGSSTASDRSKLALLLKKKRETMEERLDTPIRGFQRNENTFTLCFLLLLGASASLSYVQIFNTNDGELSN